MVRDDRFYAFIISYSSRSRSQIRRICLRKKWLKRSAALFVLLIAIAGYGLYGLTQHASHLRIEMENQRLRAENDRQRWELNELNHRVQVVEDTSRKIAEKSGVVDENRETLSGSGGPAFPLDSSALHALENKTRRLEQTMSTFDALLRERGFTPSLWPVNGKLESGFGIRHNPFGGSGLEVHTGQDIEASLGTPIVAGARGTVIFVGWQNGYGRLIIIDHGGGLTTRYGHLSEFNVEQGQEVARGQFIGRVGSTGRSTGPHLHYEVRINDEAVDPVPYLTADKQ